MASYQNCSNVSGSLLKYVPKQEMEFQKCSLKIFVSKTTRPRNSIFGMKYHIDGPLPKLLKLCPLCWVTLYYNLAELGQRVSGEPPRACDPPVYLFICDTSVFIWMYFIALHQLVVFEYFVYFISSLYMYISTLIMLIVIYQSHIFLGFMLYLQFS